MEYSIGMGQSVALEAVFGTGVLEIIAVNNTKETVTIIALPRYFVIEVEDALGQFVRGGAVSGALPSAGDYRALKPAERMTLLVLPVARSGDQVTIGDHTFPDVAPRGRARVTYKADRVMPNLPKSKQKSFVAGPLDALTLPIPPE